MSDKKDLKASASQAPMVLNGKVRKGALDRAYNTLMERSSIDALDEPYLLFGALMAQIMALETRLEKLENPNG